jgi:hypothetical protein
MFNADQTELWATDTDTFLLTSHFGEEKSGGVGGKIPCKAKILFFSVCAVFKLMKQKLQLFRMQSHTSAKQSLTIIKP